MSESKGNIARMNDASGTQDITSDNRSISRAQIRQMSEVGELSENELSDRKIIYPGMKERHVLNSFRDLRTTLMQRAKGRNFICLVSSLSSGGGATYISLNLAAAFALDKSKTALLIDCNLYDPSIDSLLNIDEAEGVTDFIDDPSIDIKDIIYASGIPRLRIIPVGSNREAGAEHYSSSRMEEFVSAIRDRYDDRFIVIDAPPILSAAETRILADLCDMAILVLPYGKVSAAQIDEGVKAIPKDKFAGVVFNN